MSLLVCLLAYLQLFLLPQLLTAGYLPAGNSGIELLGLIASLPTLEVLVVYQGRDGGWQVFLGVRETGMGEAGQHAGGPAGVGGTGGLVLGQGPGLGFPVLDPVVQQSLVGGHPEIGIPGEGALDEVYEPVVVCLESSAEQLGAGLACLALVVGQLTGRVAIVEEDSFSLRVFQQGHRGYAHYLHDTGQLLVLVVTGEERIAGMKFREDATKAPHVNRNAVREPQYNLGGPVEPALDVRVDFLLLIAARSEVYYLYAVLVPSSQQDVLGLEVAVDYPLSVQEAQTVEQRDRQLADQGQREALELVLLYHFV